MKEEKDTAKSIHAKVRNEQEGKLRKTVWFRSLNPSRAQKTGNHYLYVLIESKTDLLATYRSFRIHGIWKYCTALCQEI